jgi:hypothetical protein
MIVMPRIESSLISSCVTTINLNGELIKGLSLLSVYYVGIYELRPLVIKANTRRMIIGYNHSFSMLLTRTRIDIVRIVPLTTDMIVQFYPAAVAAWILPGETVTSHQAVGGLLGLPGGFLSNLPMGRITVSWG